MKKNTVRTIVTLSLFVAVIASSAVAQGRPQLRADIPFSFHVAGATLPAGKYTINRPGSTNSMILVRSEKGGQAAYALSSNKQANKEPDSTKLVFRRYGDQYFLAQMWAKGEVAGISFPVTKAERKVINSRTDRHLAMADDTEEVTIALN